MLQPLLVARIPRWVTYLARKCQKVVASIDRGIAATYSPPGGSLCDTGANIKGAEMFGKHRDKSRKHLSLLTTMGLLGGVLVASAAVATPEVLPVAAAGTAVTEDFASGNYSGGSGWAAPWAEVNDSATAPIWTTGQIQVVSNELSFTNIDNRQISRTVDLSGFDVGALLSYTVVSESGDESLAFDFKSGNGANDFTEISKTPNNAPSGTRYSFVLDANMIRSDAVLRVRGNDTSWGNETIVIDDIRIDNPVSNPDLTGTCGTDLTVILDESGSIDTAGAIGQVENAVRALGDGLAGSGTAARLVEFSTNPRDSVIGGTTAPTLVTAAYVATNGPLDTYLKSTTPPQNPDGYEPDTNNPSVNGNSETYTNWEGGIYRSGAVAPSNYPIDPLVFFITDGNPNTIGTAGTSTDNNGGGSNNAAAAAYQEMATLKAAGAHVIGIGVGGATDATSFGRLTDIVESENPEVWEGVGPLNIGTVDAIRVANFSGLEDALRQAVSELCSQSLDITKLDDAGTPIVGQGFTTTVVGAAPNISTFEFLDPAGAASSATAATDANGLVEFQWTSVGHVATPNNWKSKATFTEQLPAGWTVGTTPGTCTASPGGSDVPLAASVNGTGLATFTLGGGTFEFTAGVTVSCDITNVRPGQINVVKDTDPEGGTGFTFTPVGWNSNANFMLDDDGNKLSGDLAAGGTYSVSETAIPAGWAKTGAVCDNPSHDAGTVGAIKVLPGQTTTCTFTNTEAATITVAKETLPDGDDTGFTFVTDFAVVGGDSKTITDGQDFESVGLAPGKYNIAETVPAGWKLTGIECVGGTIDGNGDVTVAAGDDVTCTYTNTKNSSITIIKDVTNTNNGQSLMEFTFTGTLGDFGLKDNGVANADRKSFPNLTPGTFNVVESNANTAEFKLHQISCPGATLGTPPAGGVAINLQPGQNVTCTFVNKAEADVSVEKAVTSGPSPVVVDSNTYSVAYDVKVKNDGPGQTTYTLTDTPDFGAGTTITNIAISGAATIADYTKGANIVTNDAINGGATETYTVTVTFDVSPTMTADERTCDGATAGEGTYNSAAIVFPGGTDNDNDCVNIPDPDVTVTKTATSGPSPVALGSLSWTVGYEIEVTNSADGPATYDLDDVPGFASGVTITNQLATSSDITVNGDFNDAVGNERIANDAEIGGNEKQKVSVVVTFDYSGSVDPLDRECGADPASGDGTFNSVTVTPSIGDPSTDPACGDLPDPDVSIDKSVSSDATLNPDGTYNVSYEVKVSNAAGAGTGSYDLTDDPAFSQGITVVEKSVTVVPNTITTDPTFDTTGKIVTEEEIAQGVTHTYTVTVNLSADFNPETTYVECGEEIGPDKGLYNDAVVTVDEKKSNDDTCTDLPGDLQIEKTDGDVTVIAGGAPFTYTLSVANIGGVSTGEPVTVADVLPAEFEWVSFPEGPYPIANCAQTDQTLTCDIDPTLVDVGGESTSFTVTAKSKAGTTPSTEGYQNLSYVNSPLDPHPEVPTCPADQPAENAAAFNAAALIDNLVKQLDAIIGGNPANNVACDSTPVIDGEIEVSKTDSVPNGDTVVAGETFTYTLNVKNVGASALNEVTLADDLPASLAPVSVNAGAGWTCNAADPLACTYAGELAAGATTGNVVLTVKIADSFAGDSIDNTANSTAVVKTATDSKTVTDNATEVTPLVPPADLEIIKTASVPTPEQGTSFDWNLTVINNGPATATSIEVFDLVPSTLKVTGVTSSDFTCNNVGNAVTCTRPELTVGSSGDIVIKVTVLDGTVGLVVNSGEVKANEPDPDPTDNVHSAEVNVPAAAILPPVVVPPAGLPATGSDIGDFLKTAILLLGAGLGLVMIAVRRRRRQTIS
jgi:uncharacterized repeat protein (TIGR01451 family)